MDKKISFGFVGICGIIGMVVTVVAGLKDKRSALTGSILSTITTMSLLGTLAESVAQADLDMY